MKNVWKALIFSLLFSGCNCAVFAAEDGGATVNGRLGSDSPVTILIGVDGARWDVLDRVELPNLRALARKGVRAESLIPQFPSFSFVNFYTIVTGLYPEHHGIVHNAIYDPKLDEAFTIDSFRDSRWWGGEPIWVTAEKQGLVTATYFWVGSEARIQGIQPTYFVPLDGTLPHHKLPDPEAKVDQVLGWLDLPDGERPSFITLYFHRVDDAAHVFGVESEEERAALKQVDGALGRLTEGLRERGITNANLVVVSDHGFVNVGPNSFIDLDQMIALEDVHVLELDIYPATPIASIYPKGDVEAVYRQLKDSHPRLTVYRKEELPERFHNRNNPRVPPLIGVADPGWMITSHRKLKALDRVRLFVGMHGYDPAIRNMHGIFIAAGPDFPPGKFVRSFDNVHIYGLLAKLLRLEPAPHDGDPQFVERLLTP